MKKILVLALLVGAFGMQSCVKCESCEIFDDDHILDDYESTCDNNDALFEIFKDHCKSVAADFDDVRCVCENF